MPIIENIVGRDRLPGARDGGQVLLSALGDDAVVLGAVALARKLVGRSPFKKRFHVAPRYPEIIRAGVRRDHGRPARPIAATSTFTSTARRRSGQIALPRHHGQPRPIRPKELQKVCRGGPEILFVGAGKEGKVELSDEAQRYLSRRAIRLRGLAHGPGRRGLQPLEAAQGGADARELLRRGAGDRGLG